MTTTPDSFDPYSLKDKVVLVFILDHSVHSELALDSFEYLASIRHFGTVCDKPNAIIDYGVAGVHLRRQVWMPSLRRPDPDLFILLDSHPEAHEVVPLWKFKYGYYHNNNFIYKVVFNQSRKKIEHLRVFASKALE